MLGEALGHVDDEDGVLVKVKQVESITSVDRSPSTVIKMQQQYLLKGVWRHPNRAGGEDSGAEENETTSEGGEVLNFTIQNDWERYIPGPECRDQRHTVGVWKR